MDKRNLECYKCSKKRHFKSKCQSKLKDRIDYRNVQFLEIEQAENEISNNSNIKGVNLNHQQI